MSVEHVCVYDEETLGKLCVLQGQEKSVTIHGKRIGLGGVCLLYYSKCVSFL